jgi:hypothetical protein
MFTCKSVGKLGPIKTQGLKLANEWVEGSVKEYGDTKEKSNSQSGKSFLAINFQLHILKRVKKLLLLKKETMETLNVKLKAQQYTTTCCIF